MSFLFFYYKYQKKKKKETTIDILDYSTYAFFLFINKIMKS